MKIGLIGLGVMGYRIGANLAKASKLDLVYNRTQQVADKFSKDYGVAKASSIEELVKKSDVILTMLADDKAVSSVVEPIIPLMKGKILVDMSTISPTLSIELAKRISENNGVMFDSPVIGTSTFVEQKKLVVLVGGPKDKFDIVHDILKETSSAVVYMGNNGMGLYAKLVNNLLLASYVVAIAEAYNFGLKAGLDPKQISNILTNLSSARSPTTELKAPKLVNEDYLVQFATKHMRKDLEIIIRESQNLKAITPLSSISLQLYRMAEALGLSEKDFISVVEVFKSLSPK
ncbi:3-hydroxyisobutyrate dehydrogenase [Sulfolobus sp. A20]|uniref:NAD(P)-dependent oxidoreductase n=1 Tax=Sulfolobaceae TaxID=118883 RepID=UPI000845EF5E|nr:MULTISPECIES: NAD(P)-dependent oxidoreductase [unclassified Sulfolobus]TRM78147.1 NAD(P)-dependent oxidoreductase [Sulfolobus sp. A20-N-F8]TRM84166.1 NAD(P)-dependent oxidoreductase [Sulfolobus sp. A20-N-F6]TRM88659.1 NAD(P)-dependent oxidoreductase [Sulfolobus sp. C3]TRM97938.1 NAD(P)-dependent oxidoreductase [Sulfolobus sp. E1]AOL15633.1 3-hydroxyisobutyrate dehydrogenase [Sulfolobus sp. A20]